MLIYFKSKFFKIKNLPNYTFEEALTQGVLVFFIPCDNLYLVPSL